MGQFLIPQESFLININMANTPILFLDPALGFISAIFTPFFACPVMPKYLDLKPICI